MRYMLLNLSDHEIDLCISYGGKHLKLCEVCVCFFSNMKCNSHNPRVG